MLKDFRKRLKLEKILQGSIYSLSGGLLAAGVMIAIFQGLNFLDWYYYLISGGVGLAVFGIIFLVYYLINKVSEKDVARIVTEIKHVVKTDSQGIYFIIFESCRDVDQTSVQEFVPARE